MDAVVMPYTVYLLTSVGLMVWVGRTFFKNGRLFLVRVFHSDEALADSVNQLLLVGFYLVNLGFIVENLVTTRDLQSARVAMEMLADKIGVVTLVLGGMHFGNLYVFSRIWRKLGVAGPAPVGHGLGGVESSAVVARG